MSGKILILKIKEKTFSILWRDNQILSIQADSEARSLIGNIYVGKVQKIAENINAAFVEIQKGEMTFLPLKEAKTAFLTNRKADGSLKAGDELLVQIVKEPLKTKLASVSTKLSLAGNYVVVGMSDLPQQKMQNLHISTKLSSKCQHFYKQQKDLLKIAEKFEVIVRTNAEITEENADTIEELVIKEAVSLSDKLNYILTYGDKRTCFSCLYEEEQGYLSFIKNTYRQEYDEIITDDKVYYEQLLKEESAKNLPVRFYEDAMLPLYKLYALEARIEELSAKKVWLKSGGYLVVEPTEALTVIDVNTGKWEAKRGVKAEDTYWKINVEAAYEIAHTLRARNISGMILVDFINMKEKAKEEELLQIMKNCLQKDPVSTQVIDITRLGLMELTRKKQNKSFAEQMKEDSTR